MAADPLSFVANPNVAQDISLSLIDKAGVPTIQITDTATSTVIIEKAKANTSQVNITLSNLADTIRVKNDFSTIVPVTVNGQSGADTLVGPADGSTFTITAANAGTVDGVTFSKIARLQGSDGAADVFVFQPGGSLTSVDGGTGSNTLIGPSTGATFTETGLDRGTVKELGSASTTSFTNIARLQGGAGADTFNLNANADSSRGIDGGGGLNTVRGLVGGSTYTITGSDTGTAAGVSFTHIGKVQGTGGSADSFVLSAGAALSTGIDGGGSANNSLTGPAGGATFTITGRDAGSVGGVTFVNVGQLVGADGAADTFTFNNGSLTGGVDGGTGTQNTLTGFSSGATFTIAGFNQGTVQGTGSAFKTAFSNVGKLEGGIGADTFVVNSGAALGIGIDAGAGLNVLRGSSTGATFTITGVDAGKIEGVAFVNIGRLIGAANVADAFVLASAAAALTTGLDGGAGGQNTLTGPSTGTTFNINGPDSGRVGSVTFSNIGKLQGGTGPDTFTLAPAGSLSDGVDGGTGQNTLFGPSTGATFTITGRDAGTVGTTDFTNVGKLRGADGAPDSFVFKPGGSLSTGADGGTGGQNTLSGPSSGATFTVIRLDGGTIQEKGSAFASTFDNLGDLRGADGVGDTFVVDQVGSLTTGLSGGGGAVIDTLRLQGTAVTASYLSTGLESGRYDLDARKIVFSEIEDIQDNVIAQNRVVTGTSDADLIVVGQSGTKITVGAPTMRPITFARPTVSLTIDGAGGPDAITVITDLTLPNADLKLLAEVITVVNQKIDTTGTVRGNITFDSDGFVVFSTGSINGVANGTAAAAAARITLSGANILAGGAFVATTAAKYAGGVTGQAVAALGLVEYSSVVVDTSTITAGGLVNISATTDAATTVKATGAAGQSADDDAAVATTLLTMTSLVSFTGSSIQSGGTVLLLSGVKLRATTTADATGESAGGAAADTAGTIANNINVGGTSSIRATGAVTLSTTSDQNIATSAKASSGGVSGATPRTATVLANANAATTEGKVMAAAAVAVNAIMDNDAVTLNGAATVVAPTFTLTSNDVHVIAASADSSATASNGIAASVAINGVNETSRSTIAGSLTFTGTQVTIQAGETSTVTATAVSGKGSESSAGLAGSLAVNDVSARPTASVGPSAHLTLNGAKLALSANISSQSSTTSRAAVDSGGSAVGVGPSIALNFTDNDLSITLEGTIDGASQISLVGSGADAITTTANAGSAGGVAVTPVLALSSSDNDSTVSLKAGPALTATGSVNVSIDRTQVNNTTANAGTKAAKAGIGAALALSFGFQDAFARIDRSVTATSVNLSNRFRVDDNTKAIASARGVDSTGSRGNAHGQLAREATFEKTQTGQTPAQPDTQTSAGEFGLSAALAFNSRGGNVSSVIAPSVTVRATTGSVTLDALSDFDASATADASLVKPASGVGIGAALAVNSVSPTTLAEIDGTVNAAQGVSVRTGQASDTSSAGVDTILAKAIAGAGGNTFGGAGSLGLNVLGLTSKAQLASTANVTSGTQVFSLTAAQKINITTTGTADATSGAGGSGVGLGIGVALTILDNNVTARVDGKAVVATGTGLSLSATGDYAVHGEAKAGATSGAVGIAPSTFIVVSNNNTLAELGAISAGGSGLTLRGPVTLSATNTLNVNGSAAAAGTGASAGIGLSFGLAIVEDTAKALFSRSVSASGTGANISGRASNVIDVIISAKASAAGSSADGQSSSNGQVNKELGFANRKKGGTAETAPQANTSSGTFGLSGALALSIVSGETTAQQAAGTTLSTSNGSVSLTASTEVDSFVTADASLVKPTSVGIGAALAINSLSMATLAEIDGTVNASQGVVVRTAQATDVSSPGVDTVFARAIAGAGGNTLGGAGALGLNVLGLTSKALIGSTANVTAGTLVLSIGAAQKVDAATIATADATAGAGGSGVGVGIGVALTIAKNTVTASIDGKAVIATGAGLSLVATGDYNVHGEAKAGDTGGSVGVVPSTFIVVSQNNTLAELAAGTTNLSLHGPVTLSAAHTSIINGSAAAAGAGATAGIGLSLTLAIVEDTAKALFSRSVTTQNAGANVTARASNLVDVTLTAKASAAGAASDSSSNSDAQIGKELGFANGKKGGSAATAHSAETPNATGDASKVGVAGAISLSIVNSQSQASLASGKFITTPGSVTIEAIGDADSRVKADASTVDKSLPQVGVGVAVAINLANHTTVATVDGVVHSAGLAIHAIAPSLATEAHSDLLATAISGSGASSVGVAGAFAANFASMESQALLNVSTVQTTAGDVDIRSQVLTRPEAVASSSVAAATGGNGNGGAVGVGLSVALNVLTNESTASIPNGIALTGGRKVSISAQGESLTKTWAISGSSQGSVGITPAVALLVAEDDTTATLGTGAALDITGGFSLTVQQKVTADTKSDAGTKGASSVGVGAAVALNIIEDTADATPRRSITADGDITVSADLVADAQAVAIASNAGVTQSAGGPTTSDGQVASTTKFANHESGASTTAPQVAKVNGGSGAEQKVGVAAALALNVTNGHARALLPTGITIHSGHGVAVLSALDVDAIATADGSTALQRTGIAAAVALNVVTADNTAQLVSPTTAAGAVTVRASMSANGNGVDTFVARANSGSAASNIGVAGAVALEILNVPTKAQILGSVNAGGGLITVSAENKSDSTAVASSKATARGQSSGNGGIGVGASFALSILNMSATAEITNAVAISNAGGLTISATGDHTGVTTAEAGSASNISISPALAITIAGSDTTARLGTGAVLTTAGTGGVLIVASHHGDYQTKADGTSGGSNVSVGAAIALGIVLEHVGAATARNITAGGDVRIRATNTMASDAEATGAAKGNSASAGSADTESQSALNNNSNVNNDSKVSSLPGGKIALPKAADQVTPASSTVSSQASGRGGAKVGVGAAIGINVVSTDAIASIPNGSSITAGGAVEVASALQVDGTAKAVGTAITDALKNTSIGAGVALNVITATNAATIGDSTIINAARGVSVTAKMASINGNATNDMVVQSAAASGATKYGVAGSVTVDVLTYDTHAQIGTSSNIRAGTGSIDVGAQADFKVQNLAGSGALGANAGVGAAILVQTAAIGTTAIVKPNAQLDGAGVHVTSRMSYVPVADNFKGFGFALTSGVFGGAGSNGGTAIGGSVAVNVLNFNTEARLDAGVRINQRTAAAGSVVVDAVSNLILFGGAGGVGAATGNLGIGAGIEITLVNLKTLAQIGDGAIISAGGDISVQAHSSSQETAVAGSFGLASSTGGSGSIVVSLYNLGSDPLSGTRALVGVNSVLTSGGKISVVASNPRNGGGQLVTDSSDLIAGSLAGASGTAVGIAIAVNIRNDMFIASVGNGSQISDATGLAVAAAGALDVTMVAAAGSGGLENGAAGSVTVSTLNETASATIGRSVTVSRTGNLADVKVTAEDRTTMVKVAGAANFGSNLAIGAGLDVGVLTKNTIASIGAASSITTGGSVEVRAFSKEDISAFAASGGGSSELAIAGSIGVQVDTMTTRAFIEGTTSGTATRVAADGNVIVEASAENEMDLFAGGLGIAGTTAIGASAPIPVITKTTEAFIGQNAVVVGLGNNAAASVRNGGFTVSYVTPPATGPRDATTPLTNTFSFSLNGNVKSTSVPSPTAGNSNSSKERVVTAGSVGLRGVAVSATNYDDIGIVAISGGVAGSVAVNVTGVVNVSNITTSGRIEKGASVNAAAGMTGSQSVLVVGSNDYRSLIVSIGASVSGSAAIAPAVSVDVVNLTAEAIIAGTATVSAGNSVGVKARSAEDLQTVVASVGVASSAGISGSPAILVLNDRTTARIGDINTTGADVAATVQAGGSVVVQALDDTDVLDVDGSVGVGGTAGAGVGLAINVISKNTTARIADGSVVNATGNFGPSGVTGLGGVDSRFGNSSTWAGLLVLAGSTEDITSIAIAGGVAGTVGGAGAVNLNLITSNTAATIGDHAQINPSIPGSATQDVRVLASNDVSAVTVTGGLGAGGTAGLAGAVGVGIVHNGTEASVGTGAVVNAARNISIEASSHQDIVAVDVSGSLAGTFAGAISTGIWVLGGAFNTGGGSASESAWATTYQSTLTGAALGGFSGMLNGNHPLAFASGDISGNTINLHTSTLRTGDPVIYHSNGHARGGLVDGQTYFLIKTGTTTYSLAATAADADTGRAVTVGALNGGSIEQADNSRAQPGLQAARGALVNAQPTSNLSDSLGAGTAQNGTVALVLPFASLKAGSGMDVKAQDRLEFVQVTGQVALGGAVGVGGAFATLIHNNTVLAQIGDGVTIAANGAGLDTEALSSESVVQIAAGGGAAGAASIQGSGTVTLLNETTKATIGKNVSVNGIIKAGVNPDVKLIATDDSTVTDVAGAIGFAGAAAVGVGADVISLSKTTLATIDQNTHITTQGSVELRAHSSEDVVSVAAVGTAGGVAAVNLAASVVIANITTQAFLVASTSTVIDADGNVIIEATGQSEYDLWGISAQVAGVAAIGASAAVPVVTKNVLAEVGDGVSVTGRGLRNSTTVHNGNFAEKALVPDRMDVTSNKAGGSTLPLGSPSYANDGNNSLDASGNQRQTYNANETYAGDDNAGQHKASQVAQSGFKGVAVTATNNDDVSSTGIAAGAAAVAAVSLTGSVQAINVTTAARVGKNSKIDLLGTTPSQSVLVAAGDDFRALGIAVGGSFAAAAAVTPLASVQIVTLNTSALIDNGASVYAGNSVVVQAVAHEQFTEVAAAVSGAVLAGVSLTPNIMTLDSHTTASIGGTGAATVNAGGSVAVLAEDNSRFIDVAAAMGIGFGGVGMGGNVLLVTKSTQALIANGSSVTANAAGSAIGNVIDNLGSQAQGYAVQRLAGSVSGVVVQATSHEDITAITGAGGIGLAGIGLAADIVVVDSDTIAHIGTGATVNSSNAVVVGAANTLDSFTLAGGVGIGLAGVGGGVTIGIVRNGVEATIGNSASVTSSGMTEVIALSRKDVDSFNIAGSIGVAALAGSVGIWTFGGAVSTNYGYTDYDGQGNGGTNERDNALGHGAPGWNTTFDRDANGGAAPGGNYNSILNGQTTGRGGNTSRLAAADQSAKPTVGAAKPHTSITSQLNNVGGDIEGTVARIGGGAHVAAIGDVIVRAKDATTMTQTAGSFTGGIVSVGAPIALITLNMSVQASIEPNATVSAGQILAGAGNLTVEAAQITSVKGFVFAGSGGLLTLGAQILIITDNTDQSAWVKSGATISANGNITINATANQTYSGGAFGATLSAIGAGASVAIANVNGGTHALMDGGTASAIGSISITAMADINVKLQTYGVGLALVGGGNGAVAVSHIGKFTEARTGDSSTTLALGDVTVAAVELATANLSSYAIQIAGAVGIGVAVASATIDPSVLVHGGGTYKMIGTLTLLTEFNTDAAGNKIANRGARTQAFSVGAAIGAGLAGAAAISVISPSVQAQINNGASVVPLTAGYTPNVIIRSLTGSDAVARASGIGVGILGGVGASVARATVGGVNRAFAMGANLHLGTSAGYIGTVTIDARSADDASATSLAASGGILAGAFAVNLAEALVNNSVGAQVGAGAQIFVGALNVNAGEIGSSTAASTGVSIGGVGVAGAASVANATHAVPVNAIVDGSTVNMFNGLTIVATTGKANANARAVATGAALLAGITVNSATANSTGRTNAQLSNALVLGPTSGGVRIHAEALSDATSAAVGTSVGIAGVGSTHATSLNNHATTAQAGSGVQIGQVQFDGPSFPVGAIEISAKSAGTGTVSASGASGGIVTVPDVFAKIDVIPTARATVADSDVLYGSSLLVSAANFAEGDGTLSGKTISAIDFSSMELDHNVVQTAEAIIYGRTTIQTIGSLIVTATGGGAALEPVDPRYDGVSTVQARGFSIGIIGHANGEADANVTSNVHARILTGNSTNYTNIYSGTTSEVSAHAEAHARAVTDDSGGGAINLASSTANAILNADTTAFIGDPSVYNGLNSLYMYSTGDTAISANALLSADANSHDSGGGLASFSSSDAQARTFYRTTAAVGQGVNFTDANNLNMTASTSHHESTHINNSSSGGIAGSTAGDSNSGSFASGASGVTIAPVSTLFLYGALNVKAEIVDSLLEAFSQSHAHDLAGSSSATATSIGDDDVRITLAQQSSIDANNGVYITGNISNYHLRTDARAYATTDVNDENSYSQNTSNNRIEIDAQPNAKIKTGRELDHAPSSDADAALTVTTTLNVIREAFAFNDGAGVNGTDYYNGRDRTDLDGEQDDRSGDHSRSTITWNADVTLLKVARPRNLTIDANGYITRADGITVDGGFGVGYHNPQLITVDNISSPEVNRAVFRSTNNNVIITPGDAPVSESAATVRNFITGVQGRWSIGLGAGGVTITNNSQYTMIINNIDTIATNVSSLNPSVSIQVAGAAGYNIDGVNYVPFNFKVSPVYDTGHNDSPSIQISNNTYQTGGDIYIRGVINNPVGSTYILSGAGRILQGSGAGLIRTQYLYTAGLAIGYSEFIDTGPAFPALVAPGAREPQAVGYTVYYPVNVEFVQSPGRMPTANIFSQDAYLDVSTRLRDPSVTSATVTFNYITDQFPYMKLHAAAWDSRFQASSPGAGISVGTMSSSSNNAAGISTPQFYRSYYYPDNSTYSGDVNAAFGYNYGYYTGVTYVIPNSASTGYIFPDSSVTVARPSGSLPSGSLQSFSAQGAPSLAQFQPFDSNSIIVPSAAVAPASKNDNGVPLATPASSLAVESPLNTVVGGALMTYFGVSDDDLASISKGPQIDHSTDVLLQDFTDLEPTLTRIDRVTKPQILWQ